MGSSGAAMNGLTVAARSANRREAWPSPWCSLCSVNGLADPCDLCGLVCAQPVVVMFEVFDQGLKVAHPRPESSALQEETIVSIHSLTQQRFGHTNSDSSRVRRAMDNSCGQPPDTNPSRGLSQSPTGIAAGQCYEPITFHGIPIARA